MDITAFSQLGIGRMENRGKNPNSRNGFKKGNKYGLGKKYMLGKKASVETRAKMSKAQKGRKITWGNKIGEAKKGKPNFLIRGKNNSNWKGGITPINRRIRFSLEYKLWRTAIFERDNYTCVWCGKKEEVSGKLNADHIKPFALFPELRLAIDNGRTLCEDCHKTTDTYLWKTKHV